MEYKIKIATLIEQRGLSQYKLSKISGVSQGVISDVITGKNTPSLTTLEKLCAALGITMSEFFAEDTQPDPAEARLLSAFRRLPDDKRDTVVTMIEAL